MLKTVSGKIRCSRAGEVLLAEPYGPDVIRVRAALSEPDEERWTLLPPEKDSSSLTLEEDGGAVLRNGAVTLRVTRDGRLSFYNKEGETLLEEQWLLERDLPARQLRGLAGGLVHIEQNLRPWPEERFYGLGQEAHDLFDLKGAALDLCHQNTKSSIPFVLSSRGYGFLWNNPGVGRVEFGTDRKAHV